MYGMSAQSGSDEQPDPLMNAGCQTGTQPMIGRTANEGAIGVLAKTMRLYVEALMLFGGVDQLQSGTPSSFSQTAVLQRQLFSVESG